MWNTLSMLGVLVRKSSTALCGVGVLHLPDVHHHIDHQLMMSQPLNPPCLLDCG